MQVEKLFVRAGETTKNKQKFVWPIDFDNDLLEKQLETGDTDEEI
jgi:hypothetical protein